MQLSSRSWCFYLGVLLGDCIGMHVSTYDTTWSGALDGFPPYSHICLLKRMQILSLMNYRKFCWFASHSVFYCLLLVRCLRQWNLGKSLLENTLQVFYGVYNSSAISYLVSPSAIRRSEIKRTTHFVYRFVFQILSPAGALCLCYTGVSSSDSLVYAIVVLFVFCGRIKMRNGYMNRKLLRFPYLLILYSAPHCADLTVCFCECSISEKTIHM